MDTKTLGNVGENLAVDYLKKKGYKILAKNWRNKWGEIDIVAKKKRVVVFCEVKTIREKFGFEPEDEITPKKKKQLLKMAQIYLSANKLSLETPHQIDILAVEIDGENPTIRHIENAIEDIW